jgi:hypothetical protein
VPVANPELAALAQRDRLLQSLETSAVMEYSGPRGHLKARERIVVRRPASLRVEALSPLGVALVVTANQTQLAVFDPSQNTLARGAAEASTLDRVAQLPLAPAQAVRLLLALPPGTAALESPAAPVVDDAGLTVISVKREGGGMDQLGFHDNQLVMARESGPDGAVFYNVRYSDYQDIGAMQFPLTIAAQFPETATEIKLHYQSPAIDGAIPDSAFTLEPGPQTRELQLGFRAPPDLPKG